MVREGMTPWSRIICLAFLLVGACYSDIGRPKPLIFYVVGDWGRMGSPNQKVVAFQMNEWAKNEDPRFILSMGDNFYDVGVKNLDDPHWKASFEQAYNGDRIIRKPWYVALGNHDYNGQPDVEIAYSKVSDRWKLPSRYYSRIETGEDGSRVRLTVIDTSPFEKSAYQDPLMKDKVASQDTLRQKKWLDSLTSLTDTDWKIVVGHHHIYTGGARKNDPNTVRASLEPLFIKNNVDVYFCGHEHDLQHLKSSKGVTHYLLSGAGSDLRPTGMITESQFAASIQGFMSVTVTKKSLVINVVDYMGNILHTATVTH